MASKSISKSVIWQLIGKFILQGIYFFTTPIFTRILTPSDYGYTALYASWLSLFCLIEGLQVQGSIGNARIKYGEDKINSYLSCIMTISLISFICIFLFVFIFQNTFSKCMGISKSMVKLVTINSFAVFVINFEIHRLDQLKEVEKSTILSLAKTVVVILSSLFFVFVSNKKAEAKILGEALPTVIFASVILVFIYVRGHTFWNKDYNKFCLSLTIPLIFHGLGHLIFSQSDRIMLQKMHGENILGVYSVSFTLCSVLTVIYGALNTAWLPFYYDYKKQKKHFDILYHSSRYIKFYTLISIGFILLAYDVFKIMAPEEYYEGMKIIPVLVLSNFFGFLYLFPVNFEFYMRKTNLIPVATFSSAIINIILNLMLIPNYGLIGASIATLCAHVLLYIFHEILAKIIGAGEFEYKFNRMFIVPILIITFICIIFFFISNRFWIIRWILAFLIGIYLVYDILKNKNIF